MKGVQEEVKTSSRQNKCYWQNPRGQRELGAEITDGALSAVGASVREFALSPQNEELPKDYRRVGTWTHLVLRRIVLAGTGRAAWRRQHQHPGDSQ